MLGLKLNHVSKRGHRCLPDIVSRLNFVLNRNDNLLVPDLANRDISIVDGAHYGMPWSCALFALV